MNDNKLKESFTLNIWKEFLTFHGSWCEAWSWSGTGSPEKMGLPHPWRCSRCPGPQASWSTVWQPCTQQGRCKCRVFRVLPTQTTLKSYNTCQPLPTRDPVCLGIPWSPPLSPTAHLPCTNISHLSLAPGIPRSPVQLMNSEVRKETSIRDFSMSCLTRFPAPFYAGPTFPLAFLLSPTYFYKPFLSVICLGTLNCSWI